MYAPNLDIFGGISLDDMNQVALMKRTDTKFLINTARLSAILNEVKSDYQILQIGQDRLMSYESLYFDTDKLKFYHMHHNGVAKRVKVRTRKYMESDLSFLEIKQKDSYGDTVKKRIKIDEYSKPDHQQFSGFVEQVLGRPLSLHKTLKNSFNRFTLVNTSLNERVTVDVNVQFDEEPLSQKIAIIELKQERLNRHSPIFQALKKYGVHPYGFSKYCIGLASRRSDLKQNLFKAKFLKINRLTTTK